MNNYRKPAFFILSVALIFGFDIPSVLAETPDIYRDSEDVTKTEFEPSFNSQRYSPKNLAQYQPQPTPNNEPIEYAPQPTLEDKPLEYTPQPTPESEPLQYTPPTPEDSEVGQEDIDIDIGQPTRSSASYIGIGANIGVGEGDTAIGETSFAVFSKVGITPNISVRPGVFISDDPTILLPVTFDFIPFVSERTEEVSERVTGLTVSPYAGAGITIAAGDDAAVDFLATGGVDVPLSRQITATASVNASLFENPAVGILFGVGYNFGLR